MNIKRLVNWVNWVCDSVQEANKDGELAEEKRDRTLTFQLADNDLTSLLFSAFIYVSAETVNLFPAFQIIELLRIIIIINEHWNWKDLSE